KPRHLRGPHLDNDGRHLAGRQLGDRLHVAAVLVTEGEIADQVFDGCETLGFQHGRAAWADAFHIGERGSEIHLLPQCTMPSCNESPFCWRPPCAPPPRTSASASSA